MGINIDNTNAITVKIFNGIMMPGSLRFVTKALSNAKNSAP